MSEPIRVFLVDDHALFRSGVRAELDRSVPDVDGGRRGGLGRRGRRRDPATSSRTSCCWTCTCPTAAAPRCCAACAPSMPEVVFLALSVSDAAEDVIAVIRAGARGYVTKTISGRELADAVRRVR